MLSVPGNGAVAYRCNMLQKHFVPGKLNVLWVTLHSKILSKFSWKKKRKKNSFPRHSFAKAWETDVSHWRHVLILSLPFSMQFCVLRRDSSSEVSSLALIPVSIYSAFWFGFFQRAFVFKASRFPLKLTFSQPCSDMVISAVSYAIGREGMCSQCADVEIKQQSSNRCASA